MVVSKKLILELVGEFLATFLLGFFLFTSPMAASGLFPFVIAFIYMVLWTMFSPITKAHMNPIVTIGEYVVVLLRQLSQKAFKIVDLYKALAFIVVQFLAVLAAHPLASWFRDQFSEILILANGGDVESQKTSVMDSLTFTNKYNDDYTAFVFFVEFFLGLLFVFLFLRIVSSAKHKHNLGLFWGLFVFAALMIAYQISGASFHPFKSLVAIIFESGNKEAVGMVGLYILAPILGAISAALIHSGLKWLETPGSLISFVKEKSVEKKVENKDKKKGKK